MHCVRYENILSVWMESGAVFFSYFENFSFDETNSMEKTNKKSF